MEILAHQLPGIIGTVNNPVDKKNPVNIKSLTKFQTKNQQETELPWIGEKLLPLEEMYFFYIDRKFLEECEEKS